MTLTYRVLDNPAGGPAVIAISDIFAWAPGETTLTFQAKRVTAGFENNQVRLDWFDAGNVFIGESGFASYNPTLTTGVYAPQVFNLLAPAGTAGARIQFLTAGSAAPGDTATVLIDNVSVIPEPTTFALAGAGLLGLLRLRRRKV